MQQEHPLPGFDARLDFQRSQEQMSVAETNCASSCLVKLNEWIEHKDTFTLSSIDNHQATTALWEADVS
jgi:hypothetical protein